jgi:hypothetical protein
MTAVEDLEAALAFVGVERDRMLRAIEKSRRDHESAARACERHAGRVSDHPALLRIPLVAAVHRNGDCQQTAAKLRASARALATAAEHRRAELTKRARNKAHRINRKGQTR